jgi:hypothetical protein
VETRANLLNQQIELKTEDYYGTEGIVRLNKANVPKSCKNIDLEGATS